MQSPESSESLVWPSHTGQPSREGDGWGQAESKKWAGDTEREAACLWEMEILSYLKWFPLPPSILCSVPARSITAPTLLTRKLSLQTCCKTQGKCKKIFTIEFFFFLGNAVACLIKTFLLLVYFYPFASRSNTLTVLRWEVSLFMKEIMNQLNSDLKNVFKWREQRHARGSSRPDGLMSLPLCLQNKTHPLFPPSPAFLKRWDCLLTHQFQRVAFLFCQPQVIFTPPAATRYIRPSIPLFPRELSEPICTLLVTLGNYLVPTECLCNQTNTYPVVQHSNGQLIMKLLHCELTTG